MTFAWAVLPPLPLAINHIIVQVNVYRWAEADDELSLVIRAAIALDNTVVRYSAFFVAFCFLLAPAIALLVAAAAGAGRRDARSTFKQLLAWWSVAAVLMLAFVATLVLPRGPHSMVGVVACLWGSLTALALSLGSAFVLHRERTHSGCTRWSPWWVVSGASIAYYVLPDLAIYAVPLAWGVWLSRTSPQRAVA